VNDDRVLWTLDGPDGWVQCLMMSCCSGAELQVIARSPATGDTRVLLRELYPTKSDLYDRARMLAVQYGQYGLG